MAFSCPSGFYLQRLIRKLRRQN